MKSAAESSITVSQKRIRGSMYTLIFFLLAIVLFCLVIAVRGVQSASIYIHPPRKPITRPEASGELKELKDISFETADNVTIRGWYLPSHNRAAVILMHGLGENRMEMLFDARVLAKQGYGVLLFDWRAHGESDGDLVTWGEGEKNDLRAAINFVAQCPGIDLDKIGVVGFSLGGDVATEVAASDSRLAALVLEGIYPSFRDIIYDDFVRWGLLGQIPALWSIQWAGIDVNAIRPVNALGKLQPRPLLLINGAMNDIPPKVMDRLLQAAGGQTEYWLVQGASHGEYAKVAPEEYEKRLLTFFNTALLKKTER